MAALTEDKHNGEFIGQMAMDVGYHTELVTLASGTNFKAGDVLGKITASGKYTIYNNGAATGIEAAARVLVENVDATGADKTGLVIKRGPIVLNGNDLGWGANNAGGITAGKADLDALGIQVR